MYMYRVGFYKYVLSCREHLQVAHFNHGWPRRVERLRLAVPHRTTKTDWQNSNLVAVGVHLSATRGACMVQYNSYGIQVLCAGIAAAGGEMLVLSGAFAAAAAAHCDCSCCTCCEAKKASACDRRELPVCTAPQWRTMLVWRHICSEVNRKVRAFC